MSTSTPSDASEDTSEKIWHFPDLSMRQLLQDLDFVRYVVELLFPDLLDLLDFSRGVQQNRTSLSPALEEREADVVVRVPFRDPGVGEPVHICILIEHQSRPDWLMYVRMLIYMVRIWDTEHRQFGSKPRDQQNWSPILPIIFYTGEGRWTAPMSLTEAMNIPSFLERFVPKFDILFLDVKRADGERLTASRHPFGWLLRVLQEEDANEPAFRDALETAALEIGRLGGMQNTQLREALHYLILLILHKRSPGERDAFINIVKENSKDERGVETMVQTTAELLIEQGKEQGIAQGVEQGREQGIEQGREQGIEQGARQTSIESTLTLLTRRFPDADVPGLKPRLEAIEDLERLKALNLEASFVEDFQTFQGQVETE